MVGVKPCGTHLGLQKRGVRRTLAQSLLGDQERLGQLPTRHHIASEHQVRHAARIGGVGVVGSGVNNEIDHIVKGLTGRFKAFGYRQRRRTALVLQSDHGLLHLGGDGFGGLAAIAGGFAAHQVVGLDGGGAFVNGQDLGVAVVLRCASFFDETHAAMHLHPQRGDFQAHLGAVALDQWH